MIRILCVTLSTLAFIFLSYVFNRVLYPKLKGGNVSLQKKISMIPLIFMFVYIFTAYWLPNIIKPALSYPDFKSYLLWAEGYQEEGAFKVKSYLQTEYGYLYSVSDDMPSALAREKDGKFKKNSLRLLKEKKLEVGEDTILLFSFENSEKDLAVFLFMNFDGKDFEASVNGKIAAVYPEDDTFGKVCIMEKQANYSVTCNGEAFEV